MAPVSLPIPPAPPLSLAIPPAPPSAPEDSSATGSEKEIQSDVPQQLPPPPAKSPSRDDRREVVRDMGRGGAQHQEIQKRIKQAAEDLGFRVTLERPVLEGQGSVDLWLERPGCIVGCEVSITTTIDHEVRNVSKCLKAGLSQIAMVCVDEDRLRKLEAAVIGSLGAEMTAGVKYFQPDAFIQHLKTLPAEVPKEPTTVRRGYKIKRVISEQSTEKHKQNEAAAIRLIADQMRKESLSPKKKDRPNNPER